MKSTTPKRVRVSSSSGSNGGGDYNKGQPNLSAADASSRSSTPTSKSANLIDDFVSAYTNSPAPLHHRTAFVASSGKAYHHYIIHSFKL